VTPAGSVPRPDVLVEGRRGRVASTSCISAKQIRHVRHSTSRPRRNMAVRRLCGCAVREPRRDGSFYVAVGHDVARELAPRRRDGCVFRPEGLSSRREVRRGQQRAKDPRAPRGAARAGQKGTDTRDRSSGASRRRPPTVRAGAARRREDGEGGSPQCRCGEAAPHHRFRARGKIQTPQTLSRCGAAPAAMPDSPVRLSGRAVVRKSLAKVAHARRTGELAAASEIQLQKLVKF
jgi:hypothetical protein